MNSIYTHSSHSYITLMMNSVYIKRTELYQDEKYIIDAFKNELYAIVSNVAFIPKADMKGKYNGAIITIHKWFNNHKVTKLFDDIIHSPSASAKINHGYRFWFIQEYKNIIIKNNKNDIDQDPNNAKEQDLHAQIAFLLAKNTKQEQLIMKYEEEQTRQHLHINHFQEELERLQIEFDIFKQQADDDLLLTEQNNIRLEIYANKYKTLYQQTKQELHDELHINQYYLSLQPQLLL